ncbi:hypothetical protein F5Y19DRAFT_484468 [Xylariaceae sp. FL1651]|nr:hypothetical protein F5Y19DRAFT_484468 [Xylariaceae sp. FL1651]
MTDREESDQPRKRIAVACGRCRKRKIRCSGDPGNGGPCSNCKNAGYEPCLFLRVSSQETPFKEGSDYTYNLDAARTYAHQTRGAGSPLSTLPQYAPEMPAGDVLGSYRQSPYQYSSKGYYPTLSSWTGTYQDDGSVDYGLNYSTYPLINQDPAHLVPGYGQYGTRKPVYVDTEGPSYSYGNLVHRPASNSDSQGFCLSSMAASLPSASDRILSSDRLQSSVNRTLTSSSSYRTDGISPQYSSNKASSASTLSDVAYNNIPSTFESHYPATNALPSTMPQRPSSHTDAAVYPPGVTTPTTDSLYTPGDHSLRSTEDGGTGLSYIYSDSKLDGSRRDSHSSGGVSTGPVLSNGHVYVPNNHSAQTSPNSYVVPSVSSSQGSGINGATTSVGASGGSGTSVGRGSGSSHRPSDSHRRSGASLRGG